MDLSIIVPVYNSKSTLMNCISSISEQETHFSFEVIIVDDGSTDGSFELLNRLEQKYSWIKVIKQRNSRQAAARNNGLSHCQGRFVTFIDADDVLDKKYIQEMLKPLKENSELKWSICGIVKQWPNFKRIENISVFENSYKYSKLELIKLFLNRNKEMDAGLWNKIYLMDVIKKNKIYFKNENFYEDTLFNLEYFLCISPDEIYTNRNILYTLNRLGDSTTTTYNSKMDELSDNFFYLTKEIINKYFDSSKQIDRVMDTLKVRLTIHRIHYHLKTDINWTSDNTKQTVTRNIDLLRVLGYYDLNFKYKISCIFIRLCPGIYSKIYLKRH